MISRRSRLLISATGMPSHGAPLFASALKLTGASEIHVAAAQPAHQLSAGKASSELRRRQCGNLLSSIIFNDTAQAVRHIFQRNRPLDFATCRPA
jgi:hypothetical protein